jgi:putative membrane protein
MKLLLQDLFFGIIIGIANIIPGVSGGTMALVLGFYERLVGGINNISLKTVKSFFGLFRFKKENVDIFKEEFIKIEGFFLIKIVTGAVLAIFALATSMKYLLEYWHDPTYGFFFGLVLLSAYAPYKLIKKKGISTLLAVIIGIVGVVGVSNAVSGDQLLEKAKAKCEVIIKGSSHKQADKKQDIIHLVYIFILGMISISAMILPGVSGSFLLLVMGGYFEILNAVDSFNISILGIFTLGAIVGILLFSKILDFLLKKYYDQTMGTLLGLVFGSLWMIWPFKNYEVICSKKEYLFNIIPNSFGMIEIFTLLSFFVGVVIILFIFYLEKKLGRTE